MISNKRINKKYSTFKLKHDKNRVYSKKSLNINFVKNDYVKVIAGDYKNRFTRIIGFQRENVILDITREIPHNRKYNRRKIVNIKTHHSNVMRVNSSGKVSRFKLIKLVPKIDNNKKNELKCYWGNNKIYYRYYNQWKTKKYLKNMKK